MSVFRVLPCFLLLGWASHAEAQTKDAAKQPPAPVAATPERTTATFGDWIMRCEVPAQQSKRVCEVAYVMTLQGQNAPVAQVAVGKPEPTGGKRLTLVVPPNIAFGQRPEVATANKSNPAPMELTWQRCAPGACFATVDVSDQMLAALGAQSEPGRIAYKDAADREVALPLSFRGLQQALVALAKE
jgi:invasion protein IalB